MHAQRTALNTKVKKIFTIRVLGLPVWTRVFKVDFIVVSQQKTYHSLLWPSLARRISCSKSIPKMRFFSLSVHPAKIILERQSSQGGQRSSSLPSEGTWTLFLSPWLFINTIFIVEPNWCLLLLTYSHFSHFLAKLVTAIGLDPCNYSPHNFHRDSATFAFACNQQVWHFLIVFCLTTGSYSCKGDWKWYRLFLVSLKIWYCCTLL